MADREIIDVYGGGEVRGGSVKANPLGRPRKATDEIVGIVLHHTAGTSLVGAMTAGQQSGKQKGTGAQYYVDTDGKIYRYLPDNYRIAHIQDTKFRTDKGKATTVLKNSNTIGVEIVAPDSEHMTDAQVEAVLYLTSYLRAEYPTINPDLIVGHGEIQGGKGGNKMLSEGVRVAQLSRRDAAGLLPPGSIPTVASELDTGSATTAPRPFPSHLADMNDATRLAIMRAEGQARAQVLASSAMFGWRPDDPNASREIPAMTPGQEYGMPGSIQGVIADPRLMDILVPSYTRFDPVGEGPVSWFGGLPDAAVGGIGSPAMLPSGAVLTAGAAGRAVRGNASTFFETVLPPEQEAAFEEWKARNAPDDSGYDYDLRGAFAAGAEPAENGHWPDTFKKPWHPTFSDESQYAVDAPDLAGHWIGETYVPASIRRADEVGAGPGSYGDLTRMFGVPLPAPAPLTAPEREPTPNTRGELDAFVQSVYAGILPIDPGDGALFEGGAPSSGAAAGLPARTSAIPAGVVGRWDIETGRAADVGDFTAPKLTTSIAFSPTLDMARASEVLAGTRYADMGLAIDRFTLPPVAAPSKSSGISYEPPKLEWTLLDSEAWNAAMQRREQLASRPPAQPAAPAAKPAPAVKAPTVDETRAEQRAERALAPKTSTSTVTPPTKLGIAGAAAAGAAAPVMPVSPTFTGPIQPVPSAKPEYRTITMTNPAYVEWEQKYGGGTVGGPGYDGVGLGLGSFADFQRDMGISTPNVRSSPNVPPAPVRTITKKVPVKAPAAPTPMPASARPPSSSSSGGKSDSTAGGLYTVQKGDTLSGIAQRSGVSVSELVRINNIKDPNKIYAGSTIKLTGTSGAAAPAAAKTSTAKPAAAKSSSSATVIKGSASGREYVVGKVYVTASGVKKMAMADGTFKTI